MRATYTIYRRPDGMTVLTLTHGDETFVWTLPASEAARFFAEGHRAHTPRRFWQRGRGRLG